MLRCSAKPLAPCTFEQTQDYAPSSFLKKGACSNPKLIQQPGALRPDTHPPFYRIASKKNATDVFWSNYMYRKMLSLLVIICATASFALVSVGNASEFVPSCPSGENCINLPSGTCELRTGPDCSSTVAATFGVNATSGSVTVRATENGLIVASCTGQLPPSRTPSSQCNSQTSSSIFPNLCVVDGLEIGTWSATITATGHFDLECSGTYGFLRQ